jgi:hypothetical protein
MIYEDKSFAPIINQDVEEAQGEEEEPSTEETEGGEAE